MPWTTPTLREVREIVRDDITAALSGALVAGNSVLRIMADAKAGLAHLTLRYIDWLSRQLLPDTAEVEWLDRHGNIWLVNADGSVGRKSATFAVGSVTFTGVEGTTVPQYTRIVGNNNAVEYETDDEIVLGPTATEVTITALSAGAAGNLLPEDQLTLATPIAGVDDTQIVVLVSGGADEENDEDLRRRILLRIQRPPMGGDADDYVLWALAVPGVTRAWAAPLEMGMGTVTVRFLMDDLRADNFGLPEVGDIEAVQEYLDTKRPVAVKDFFVVAPILQTYDLTISGLEDDTTATRARIEEALHLLDLRKSAPGQTMYRSWVSEAISSAVGEDHHELTFTTTPAESLGHMPVLGTITYA